LPWALQVLDTARALGLPDWYSAAGAIRNTVWDALHGSVSPTPHSDLDVIYFDAVNSPNDARCMPDGVVSSITNIFERRRLTTTAKYVAVRNERQYLRRSWTDMSWQFRFCARRA
jgi:hypothetical protein